MYLKALIYLAYASCTLTVSENYSQIVQDMLALVFSVNEVDPSLFGWNFTLCCDTKLVVSNFGYKKGISKMAANIPKAEFGNIIVKL